MKVLGELVLVETNLDPLDDEFLGLFDVLFALGIRFDGTGSMGAM